MNLFLKILSFKPTGTLCIYRNILNIIYTLVTDRNVRIPRNKTKNKIKQKWLPFIFIFFMYLRVTDCAINRSI